MRNDWHEGQLADVFTPGLYMLETNNMPVMTTLQHWDHGFESPFKSEIYFVNTTRFNDLKWGTKNPLMLRDPEFGPTRIRAFGTYSVRVTDPARFLTEIVGTDGEFTMDEISFQIRNIIVQEFSRAVAASGIPVLDMANVARAMAPAMVIIGGQVFISGWNISKEAEIHSAAIQELSESFGDEMQPVTMEFEGQQYELTGSAEEQFKRWKELLRQIYFAETGFEPTPASDEEPDADQNDKP